MGSSNFQIFNPTQANQETDAEYLADATRTGGALDGNAWPDVSSNKTLYQATIMVAALGQSLANKGFVISDASYSALVAALANILTSADLRTGVQNIAWASTVTLNVAKFLGFSIALTSSTTVAVGSGAAAGQLVVMIYSQGSAGGATVTFPSSFIGAVQPDPTANVTSCQVFIVDAALNFIALGPLLSPSGINGTAIGVTVPAAGNFSTLKVSSAAPLGQVLTGNGTSYVAGPGIGNQTVNLSASRALGTTYQNTTGSPLNVSVSGLLNFGGGAGVTATIQARIGASSPSAKVATDSISNGSGYMDVYFTVPPGWYYGVYTGPIGGFENEVATLDSWVEWSY